MAANDNYNNLDELYQENLRELFGAIGSFSKASDKAKKVIEDGKDLLKDSTSLLDKTAKTIESTMTFSSRTLAESFKNSMSTATKKLEAAAKLERDKNAVNDMVKELEKALDSMEQAAGSQKAAASSYEYQLTQSKLNDLKQHQVRLNNIKSESAYSKQLMKETKAQGLKIITSLADSIISVFTESLKAGYNNLSSTYESTYGDITSMNSYSHKDVDRIINELQSFVKENKLEGVVTVSDYLPEIQNILKGGLTKDLATTVAKYSVLAKESGYSADFADPAFLKQIKNMADAGQDVEQFMKDIIGSTKAVTESVGDAFGFANGQINTMTASISDLAQVMNMSQDAATNTYRSYAALNGILGSTEFDTSKLYSSINEYAQNGINSQSAEQLLGYRATAQQFQQKIEAEGTEGIIKDMFKQLYTTYAGRTDEWISVASSALGSSFSTQDLESLMKKYNSYAEFEEAFNKTLGAANKSDGEKVIDELKNYQTKNESFNNKMENHMTDIVQISKDSVWTEKAILAAINALNLKDLLSLLKNSPEVAGKVKDIASLFKSSLGSTGSLAKAFKDGTAFASKGGKLASFGKVASSTGVKVAGKALGAIGSAAAIGIDAYKGYKDFGAEGAWRGAITGSGDIASSGWDVAKGTGSAALKGAGIGMLFGPWGAAIGAGIGAIAGLTTTLTDLNDEQKQFTKRLTKNSQQFADLNKRLQETNKSTAEFESKMKDTQSLENIVKQLKIGEKPSEELLNKFPEYTSYLDSNGKTTKAYVESLTEALKIQKELNLIEQNKKSMSNGKDYYGLTSKRKAAQSDYAAANKKVTSLESVQTKKNAFEDVLKNAKDVKFSGNSLNVDGKSYSLKDLQSMYSNDTLSIDDIFNAGLLPSSAKLTYTPGKNDMPTYNSKFNTTSSLKKGTTITGDQIKSVFGYENITYDKYRSAHTSYEFGKSSNIDYTSTKLTDAKKDLGTAQTNLATATGNSKQGALNLYREFSNSGLGGDKYNSAGSFSTWATSDGLSYDLNLEGEAKNKSGTFENKLYNYNEGMKALLEAESTEAGKQKIRDTYANLAPSKLKDWYNSYRQSMGLSTIEWTPAFATGLDYVPYDNYLARLHKGEQVKTAAEVNLERANFSSDGTNKMATALKDTLVTQTDSIISILNDIYSLMSSSNTSNLGKRYKLNYSLPTGANEA